MTNNELQALETWVQASLVERFGPVVQEDVPAEWLRLIDGEG